MIRDEELHDKSMDMNANKVEIYDIWADTYDKYVESLNYKGPKEVVTKMLDIINIESIDKPLRFLDFGCGTGLVGEEILSKKNSIKREYMIDGIDISNKMIEIALGKNIYNNIYNIDLHTTEVCNNTKYDVILSSGVFLEGHVNFSVIDTLYKLLTANGVIIVTIRDSYKDKNKDTFYSYLKYNKLFKGINISNIEYLPDVKCSIAVLKK
jgi:predicted TPR repeat methyltransferase